MRNLYYTYHVAHKQRPADVKDLYTIDEVIEYTKLCSSSVYDCLIKKYHVKGWIITRTQLPKEKKPKEKKPSAKGVIAYLPDGEVKWFRTQKECGKALGVSEGCVYKHLKDGKADRKGNEYDYPA